jgi:hypothetical protein
MTEANSIQLNDEERQPCEVWTRVMGYHRPVSSFNGGKKSEHEERQFFRESSADAESTRSRCESCSSCEE